MAVSAIYQRAPMVLLSVIYACIKLPTEVFYAFNIHIVRLGKNSVLRDAKIRHRLV